MRAVRAGEAKLRERMGGGCRNAGGSDGHESFCSPAAFGVGDCREGFKDLWFLDAMSRGF